LTGSCKNCDRQQQQHGAASLVGSLLIPDYVQCLKIQPISCYIHLPGRSFFFQRLIIHDRSAKIRRRDNKQTKRSILVIVICGWQLFKSRALV